MACSADVFLFLQQKEERQLTSRWIKKWTNVNWIGRLHCVTPCWSNCTNWKVAYVLSWDQDIVDVWLLSPSCDAFSWLSFVGVAVKVHVKCAPYWNGFWVWSHDKNENVKVWSNPSRRTGAFAQPRNWLAFIHWITHLGACCMIGSGLQDRRYSVMQTGCKNKPEKQLH
jgi:hypothetical protein